MKRNRKRGTDEEINFWQPASDMFSALLLILMLVILLLGLYLTSYPIIQILFNSQICTDCNHY